MTTLTPAIPLGLAIDLSGTASAHTRTFLHATRAWAAGTPGADLTLVSDDRSADGGERAAAELLRRGVRGVVGHYSSRAALAALPLYGTVGVPLLLPAATADTLPGPGRAHVGRLCASDADLHSALGDLTAPWRDAGRLAWHVETSQAAPEAAPARRGPGTLQVVLGSEAFAREALARPAAPGERWLLVDDAGSPALLALSTPARPIQAFGNRSRWPVPPPRPEAMFYWETWCALDIAFQLASRGRHRVAGQSFNTTCGVLTFGDTGQAETAAHGVWEAPLPVG